jgi:DNA-binding transcriptional LysR family regulator
MLDSQLRQLDLSVLTIFRDLVQFRDPNIVGARLKLRTSAISECVRRLRVVFNDPLFTHVYDQMEPTPFALELALKVDAALGALTDIIDDPRDREWVYSRRLYRIAADEPMTALIFGSAVASLLDKAPGSRTSWRLSSHAEAFTLLNRNEIDLAVCLNPDIQPEHKRVVLAKSPYVVVARKSHPGISSPLTLETYLALNHVEINTEGELSGPLDVFVRRWRTKRNVLATAPSVETACRLIAEANIVATVPVALARPYIQAFDLNIWDLPFEYKPATFSVVRHVHSDHDQTITWMIDLIKGALTVG